MYQVQKNKRSMVITIAAIAMLGVSAPVMSFSSMPAPVRSDALAWYVGQLPAAIAASAPTIPVSDSTQQ